MHVSWIFFYNYKIQQKPIEESISKKLASKFQPQHLEVINESSKHNVPKGEWISLILFLHR